MSFVQSSFLSTKKGASAALQVLEDRDQLFPFAEQQPEPKTVGRLEQGVGFDSRPFVAFGQFGFFPGESFDFLETPGPLEHFPFSFKRLPRSLKFLNLCEMTPGVLRVPLGELGGGVIVDFRRGEIPFLVGIQSACPVRFCTKL